MRGISGRRVRVLCGEGRIPGATKDGNAYKTPAGAAKPADGRAKTAKGPSTRFLKWDDQTIGTIDAANAVKFSMPDFNDVVAIYTRGAENWTADQFTEFLSERVVSRDRRDIERILFRCGLSHYRFDAALAWITKTAAMVSDLG